MSRGKNFVRGRLLCVLFSILIGPLAAVCWSEPAGEIRYCLLE